MLTSRRSQIGALCVALIAAACGGSPTRPSDTGGAVVAGSVYFASGNPKGINAASGAPASGLTVTIVGTNLTATVQSSGYFQITGVPSGTIRLQFSGTDVNGTMEFSNVKGEELVEIEVQINGGTVTLVTEVRTTSKVSLCHKSDEGRFHMITVSTSAEPAHIGHGDGKVGQLVPGSTTLRFDENCRPAGAAVEIVKSTNGEDANSEPGPTVLVGNTVTWTYVVTNTGTVNLTEVAVRDDREGAISCPTQTLAPSQSMTCTKSRTSTLVGQYENEGTVTAKGTVNSTTVEVTDRDDSHYIGRLPETAEGPKVKLCHRTGNGSYHLIEVGKSAEPAHLAHGDGYPNSSKFTSTCQLK